jgi:hypothetical protein
VNRSVRVQEDKVMDPEFEMLFEMTMRMFLGGEAYQTAGQVHNEKHRKEWYRKCLKKIVKQVQEIDTTTRHKESIAHYAEHALAAVGHGRLLLGVRLVVLPTLPEILSCPLVILNGAL